MAEPFKNWINIDLINGMSMHFGKHNTGFNQQGFVAFASDQLESLELKARTAQVTQAMIEYLPDDFEHAGQILLASLGAPLEDDLSAGKTDHNGIGGWGVIAMADYVSLQGQEHFEFSMLLLKEITQRATSEFAIRPFLMTSTQQTLTVLGEWALDENQHVRRLVSEGSRPRLPWGSQLPVFIHDPSPVIALLELLKDDDKEYVRRSVANNLNDIAKDHPDIVADIAERWMQNATHHRKRLIKHGCRTLIKKGHKKTLQVLGYESPQLKNVVIEVLTPTVIFGDALEFSLSVLSDSVNTQPLMIDYVIHHQKANGTTSPKVFKWKSTELAAGQTLAATKKHAIKAITTRVYYSGTHTLELVINGVSMGAVDFELDKRND